MVEDPASDGMVWYGTIPYGICFMVVVSTFPTIVFRFGLPRSRLPAMWPHKTCPKIAIRAVRPGRIASPPRRPWSSPLSLGMSKPGHYLSSSPFRILTTRVSARLWSNNSLATLSVGSIPPERHRGLSISQFSAPLSFEHDPPSK